MAPKKLPAKRARKDATREGSSAAPQVDVEFDKHRFRSEEHQRHFEAIKGITPPRHLVDPEKSNRALGFSALVTGLCQFYGVPVTPTKLIQPPINRAFIEKYCMPRQFGATVAWPGDRPSVQTGAGSVGTSRDGDGAQDDDDIADGMDFFL
ncbi:hypothetical protein HKD37_06G016449 [Glycine soja]